MSSAPFAQPLKPCLAQLYHGTSALFLLPRIPARSSLSASSLDPLHPLHPHAPLDPSLTALPGRGVRRPQAVAVSMAPKDADPLLRFFDCCPAYAQHDEYTEQWISGWMQVRGRGWGVDWGPR